MQSNDPSLLEYHAVSKEKHLPSFRSSLPPMQFSQSSRSAQIQRLPQNAGNSSPFDTAAKKTRIFVTRCQNLESGKLHSN
jgi:hypothetical protein